MKIPKLVVGQLINDQLLVKSVTTNKSLDWIKWLDSDELVEFFTELFQLLQHITDGEKNTKELSTFLSEWRETSLINSEPDVLTDIIDAQEELSIGKGKEWSQIKEELGL